MLKAKGENISYWKFLRLEPYNAVESKAINESISSTELVADTEYGSPLGNLNSEPYDKLPEVEGCVILKLIDCPGWMLEAVKSVSTLEESVRVKKLPVEQSSEAVWLDGVMSVTEPKNEPVTTVSFNVVCEPLTTIASLLNVPILTVLSENASTTGIPEIVATLKSEPENESLTENNWPSEPCTSSTVEPEEAIVREPDTVAEFVVSRVPLMRIRSLSNSP